MNDADVPDPFQSARRIAAVTVMLDAGDIMNAWDGLNRADAQRILDQYGSTIAGQMIAAGIRAAVAIIKQEGATS